MCWPFSLRVFHGTPRGDVTPYAPRDAPPRLVGPALPGAAPYAAATGLPFLHGLLSPPSQGRAPLATIYQKVPARGARERPACCPAAQPPAGRRQGHSGRALLGAWGTIVPRMQKLGPGHQMLLPGRTRRAYRPPGSPALPENSAPGRTRPPGARSQRLACRSGGTVLLAWSCPPCLPDPPGLGPPSVSPVHALPKDAGHTLPLGHGA